MAGSAVSKTTEFLPGSEVEEIRASLNTLIDDVEAIRAALVAHTHTENTAASYVQNATTGTPTAATIAAIDTAAELLAYKINKLQ
jgi:hypothetical protein